MRYIVNHYLHVLPLNLKSKLKYPYLQEEEIEEERNKIAEIIMREYKDKIILNNCPNCEKLARSPYARQCRYCRYDWH